MKVLWTLLTIWAVAMIFAIFTGCAARVPPDLDKLQRDVQSCILSGGHPTLGPDRLDNKTQVLCIR